MERIKNLDTFQKIVLILMAVMLVYFTVAYAVSINRKGFAYQESIFVAEQEGENTVYSGKIEGAPASFTVTPEKVVTFHYRNQTYGPYTAKEDPTAVPEGESGTGVEIRNNGKIMFRGSVLPMQDGFWLVKEDGSVDTFTITAIMGDGTVVDMHGNVIDPYAPTAHTILKLMKGPDLTSYKGAWPLWMLGVVFSAMNAISILFADELFRWRMSWRVSNPESIDPSDWEIGSRYIGWAVTTVIILVYLNFGLNYLP